VLLIGASGYVGSALAERLTAEGHEVVALARPGSTSPAVPFERRFGDLKVPASLTAAVTDDIDGVVHAAASTGDARMDAAAVAALTKAMHGTIRPFVYTSSLWVLGAAGAEGAATIIVPPKGADGADTGEGGTGKDDAGQGSA